MKRQGINARHPGIPVCTGGTWSLACNVCCLVFHILHEQKNADGDCYSQSLLCSLMLLSLMLLSLMLPSLLMHVTFAASNSTFCMNRAMLSETAAFTEAALVDAGYKHS